MHYRLDDGKSSAMRIRSMVGLIPLYACTILGNDVIEKLPIFKRKLEWFKKNRDDLVREVSNRVLTQYYIYIYYYNFVFSSAPVHVCEIVILHSNKMGFCSSIRNMLSC